MPVSATVRSFLRNVFRKRRVEADLQQEIASCLELLADEHIRKGMTPGDAERAARMNLEGVEQLKEEVREGRVGHGLQSMLSDCRYGLRQLRRTPGFTAVAVATLALGIGANTAIFSVVHAVVLAPLPYGEPDQLVMVWLYNRTLKHSTQVSYADFLDWKRNATSFQQMAAFTPHPADLQSPGTPEHLEGKRVSSGIFQTLGVKLRLGQEFTPQQDVRGGARVAMISDRLWRDHFAGSPHAIGRPLTLDGTDYTIIGVLPPDFHFWTDADVYLPLAQGDALETGDRATHNMMCVARLRPAVSMQRAQAEMNSVQQHLDRLYPSQERGLGTEVVPLKRELTGDVRPILFLLLGSVGVVLLIACANVANLLLARSSARAREFAIRGALGANSARIVRQLITESLLLSLAGGTVGLAVAKWGIRALLAAMPGSLPAREHIGLNTPVLLFALAVSIAVAVLFGLAPALNASKLDLEAAFKEGGRTTTNSHAPVQSFLVISQIALTLVLLVGAGLLFRTVRGLWAVHPGFDTDHIVTLKVGLAPNASASPEKMRVAYQQLMDRIREVPGIQAADITMLVPLSGQDDSLPFWVGSQEPPSLAEAPRALSYSTGPDYLKVMGIPLLRGRFFNLRDTPDSLHVVVIDTNMARRCFPGRDPVGQVISFVHVGAYRVIGVVGHVRHWGLDDVRRSPYQIYAAVYQISDRWLTVMSPDVTVTVRTGLSLSTIMPRLQAAVYQTDGRQPIYAVRSMQQFASASIAQRVPMILMGTFAGLALVLSAVGIYGLMSYGVAQRAKEIGIRVAVGAEKLDVFRIVIARGLRLSAAGIGIGGLTALLLARALSSFSSLLYGVGANDPITFALVSAVLILVAVLACFVPARRAMGVDPIIVLRQD